MNKASAGSPKGTHLEPGKAAEVIFFPPYSTCQLCRNHLADVCFEECAPARDYRRFQLKEKIDLLTMPRFPLQDFLEEMSPNVRQIVVAIYIAKITDFLQGV